jgi:hypothetical protein
MNSQQQRYTFSPKLGLARVTQARPWIMKSRRYISNHRSFAT